MELIDCGDIDFTKCGACMCENCSNCNKWKKHQEEICELTKNIKRKDCFWDSRKDAKEKELEINELKQEVKKIIFLENKIDFLEKLIDKLLLVCNLNKTLI